MIIYTGINLTSDHEPAPRLWSMAAQGPGNFSEIVDVETWILKYLISHICFKEKILDEKSEKKAKPIIDTI